MRWEPDRSWRPTRLVQVGDSRDTSTGVTEVLTDAGRAYVKPLGNRQGPHPLACDWVATHLARWFGLTTFDIALLPLGPSDGFPLPRGHHAAAGPAFASRAVEGHPWGRTGKELDCLANPEDITRLVVFDIWTQNCDRHDAGPGGRRPNHDNVFLMTEGVEGGKARLVAMDHGLCFIRSGEDLSPRLAEIGRIKDARLFGLFPEFARRLRSDIMADCVERLREMPSDLPEHVVASIPVEWDVNPRSRAALAELIVGRAAFVAEHVEEWAEHECPWFAGEGDG